MQQHPAFTQQSSKPFLKWAGGKQRLLSQLLGRLPQANRLIEPFVGAGSLFLSGRYPRAILNDANADLMALWTFIQERPAQFCADASGLFCEENRNKRAYECIRQKFNSEVDRYERCVRLLYLNRFGFNGLYRVNKTGSLNTPYREFARSAPTERAGRRCGPWATPSRFSGGVRRAGTLSGPSGPLGLRS